MDAVTLSNDEINSLAGSGFVAVRVNTDQREGLTRRFSIRDLPALVFLSSTGLEILRMPNDYTNSVQKVLSKMQAARKAAAESDQREATLRKAIATNPRSGSARRELALLLRKGRRYADARVQFLAAYQRLKRYGLNAGPDQMLAEVAYIDLKLRHLRQARETAALLLSEFPRSGHRAQMVYYQGLAVYYSETDRAPAVALWKKVIADFPRSPWSTRARRMIAKASTPKK